MNSKFEHKVGGCALSTLGPKRSHIKGCVMCQKCNKKSVMLTSAPGVLLKESNIGSIA